MTTPDLLTTASQNGAESSPATSLRLDRLKAQASSELAAAVQGCLANAIARGYSPEELAASYLGGAQEFQPLMDGAPPTFEQAVELARACGFRLRVSMEILDDEIQLAPSELKTPFEVTLDYARHHAALKHLGGEAQEDMVRGILHRYHEQMREKGYYLANRRTSQ